jgi:cobalt/nickel transport system permease protein
MKVPQSLRDIVESAESLVYVEDLSKKRGLLQAINPLVKLVVVLIMIISSLFVASLLYLVPLCAISIVLAIASQIPLKSYLFRNTLFIPAFAAIISLPTLFLVSGHTVATVNLGISTLVVTSEGLQQFLVFTVRVWFCVATLNLFMLSTGFERILKLLASLKVPAVVVQMFSLTYRYSFVSVHEAESMLMAKEARTYVHSYTLNLPALRDLGSILAALFIRTYERSERVYLAMKARGFEIETDRSSKSAIPAFRSHDFLFTASIIVALGLIAFV